MVFQTGLFVTISSSQAAQICRSILVHTPADLLLLKKGKKQWIGKGDVQHPFE